MTTRVKKVHRIVITIAIQVQTIDGFGVQVGGIIGRDESAPFGRVIPGITVIQTGVIRTIIALVTKTVVLQPSHRHIYFTIFLARSQEKASQAMMVAWEACLNSMI